MTKRGIKRFLLWLVSLSLLGFAFSFIAPKGYGFSLLGSRQVENQAFTPFPQASSRSLATSDDAAEKIEKTNGFPRTVVNEKTGQSLVLTDSLLKSIGKQFLPRPMTSEELAQELETSPEKIEKLENWVQARWDAYQQNPDPQLEALKETALNRCGALIEGTLGFSIDSLQTFETPPPGAIMLSPEEVARFRHVMTTDPELKVLDQELAAFGSIPDDLISPNQSIVLDRAGPIQCVSPNDCFRQGTATAKGFNAFAECCNCFKCSGFFCFPVGCLNLICPGSKPAIYDYCTGTCGCDP